MKFRIGLARYAESLSSEVLSTFKITIHLSILSQIEIQIVDNSNEILKRNRGFK